MVCRQLVWALALMALVATAKAANITAKAATPTASALQSGSASNASAPVASGPAPTESITAQAPTPTTPGIPATGATNRGPHYDDDLAPTPTPFNQLQVIGTFASGHITPATDLLDLLNTTAVQTALGDNPMFVPDSLQFTQPGMFNQLETYGIRQMHFPVYNDPNGTQFQESGGLQLAGMDGSLVDLDEKYSYPGFKTFSDPNFDFNSTCLTFVTCLQEIKNWFLDTAGFDTLPITIYVEPRDSTVLTANAAINADFAKSNVGGPGELTQALPIDESALYALEGEVYYVYNNNEYYSVVTPDQVRGNASSLADAVLHGTYTTWPALDELKGRLIFVLTGENSEGVSYSSMYESMYPGLQGALFFTSAPYNSSGKYDNSTLFVDIIGPVANSTENFTMDAANTAVATQVAAVEATVKLGYMVRSSADYLTIEAREDYTTRATDLLNAGAHFVQTSFPVPPTDFTSSYTVTLPERGNVEEAGRCNPITSGGILYNATALALEGCPGLTAEPPTAVATQST